MSDLRVDVKVRADELDKLATASQQTAASIANMSAAFQKAGMSAAEAQSAMRNMGISASEAAAATRNFATAATVAGDSAAKAAVQYGTLDRALAAGTVRLVAAEAGLGSLGSAFARVGAASLSLGPVLAGAFVVTAFISLVDILARASEAYEKFAHLGEVTVHALDDQTLSLAKNSDALDVSNIKLENQIAKLEHRPENFLALALAEDKLRADELTKSLADALQQTVKLLEAGPGIMSGLFLGKGNVSAVGSMIEPLERQFQLAALAGDKEAQKNVLLREQLILQKALATEQAQHIEDAQEFGPEAQPLGRAADPDALNAYKSALASVNAQLEMIAKTSKESSLAGKLASAETAHAALEAAQKREAIEAEVNADMIRNAKHDLEEFQKLMKGKLDEEIRVAKEVLEVRTQAAKEEATAREIMDKESATAFVTTWREAIKRQAEESRIQQKQSEDAMRQTQIASSASIANLSGGPFTNTIRSQGLDKQAEVASAAMEKAKASAQAYDLELGALAQSQSKIDTSTTEGASAYSAIQSQIDAVRRQYDNANEAANRWKITLTQIKTEQQSLNITVQQAALNASNSMFASFNSNFMKMIEGGQSFGRTMQNVWTSMAGSFIQSVLKMGEQWVAMELLKLATTKAAGAAATESSLAENTIQRFSAAKTAAAQAMTTVPFPLDLVVAPIVFAAALAFEKGGIVPGASGAAVPAMVHAGEMILPRNISTYLQTQAGSGVPRGSGSMPGASQNKTLHLHNHMSVSTLDADGIDGVLQAHGDKMVSFFKSRARKMGYAI